MAWSKLAEKAHWQLFDDFQGALWSTTADNFVTPNGKWNVDANGGTVQTLAGTGGQNVLEVKTLLTGVTVSSRAEATARPYRYVHLKCNFRLDEQGTPGTQAFWCPYPFLGWVDDTHMFFFVFKTDGWEISKYDGGINPTNQRFIATGASPACTIGQTYAFEAWMAKDTASNNMKFRVNIDGSTVGSQDHVDTQPYMQGNSIIANGTSPFLLNNPNKIFFAYCEASRTTWDHVFIEPIESWPF